MRPAELTTKIFLDSGDPGETRQCLDILGFLDGQTTNPSLIAKNPDVAARKAKGQAFGAKELWDFYRAVVREISGLIPQGSVSVEVYADKDTGKDKLMAQAHDCYAWIPNAHVKLPTSREGLLAAHEAVGQGMRVNMTLCFTQSQAAAVYAATAGGKPGQVFVSPFVGRLDDLGQNGMDLIGNILRMYRSGDGHVSVLSASVRSMEHFLTALALGSDIITSPLSVLKEWGRAGRPMPGPDFAYKPKDLAPIAYEKVGLGGKLDDYDLHHDLTVKGMAKFSADWNALMGS